MAIDLFPITNMNSLHDKMTATLFLIGLTWLPVWVKFGYSTLSV